MEIRILSVSVPVILLLISCVSASTDFYEVSTKIGTFKGALDFTRTRKSFYGFRGIRYAEPPTGSRRFADPVPVRKLKNTFDATQEGPACPQPTPLVQSEDCLRLNIYTSYPLGRNSTERKYPVIIYIHTGAFYLFSGQSELFGPAYLLDQKVVLVTINYRLGALGFLSTGDKWAPGNLGIRDQIVAMEFVRQHIENFGGDKESVTLAGSDAGASSITLHLVLPRTWNLFHRVILLSGSGTYQTPLPNHQKHLAIKQARFLNCSHSTSEEIIRCLRTKSADDIAYSVVNFYEWRDHPIMIWTPVVEKFDSQNKRLITNQPASLLRKGLFHKVPALVGVTENELGAIIIPFVEEARNGNTRVLDEVNKNWIDIAPKLFWYESDTRRSKDISVALKKFYFKGERINLNNSASLGKMFRDVVAYSAHRFVNVVSQVSSAPIYYMQFSKRGNWSHNSWSNGTTFGVGFLDDLQYLFYSSRSPYIYLTDPNSETVDRMTGIWSSFAHTGYPVPQNDTNFRNFSWDRFTKGNRKYLNFGDKLEMATNLNADEMQEWDKLFNF